MEVDIMYKKFVLIFFALLVLSFNACENDELILVNNFDDESKKMCHDFLISYYTTTEDEIQVYDDFYNASRGKPTAEQYKIYDDYYSYRLNLYKGLFSERARDEMITNGYMNMMSQFAFNHDTSFEVEDLVITIFNDDSENDRVYAFIVKIKDQRTEEITELEGQVRLEKINGLNLITAANLVNSDYYMKYYKKMDVNK